MLAAEDGEWIAFRHALLAEAVYADLLPGEVAGLHRAYLRQLIAPTRRSGSQAETGPSRAAQPRAAGRADRVATPRPGRRADVLAPVEELRHLETVLQLWDAVPDAADRLGQGPDRRADGGGAARPAGPGSRAAPRPWPVAALDRSDPARAARLTPAAAYYLIDDQREPGGVELSRARPRGAGRAGPVPDRARLLAAHARSALNSDRDDEARVTAERAVDRGPAARGARRGGGRADHPGRAGRRRRRPGGRAVRPVAGPGPRGIGRPVWPSCAAPTTWPSNRYYAGELAEAARICDAGIDTRPVGRRAVDRLRRRHADLPRADPLHDRRSDRRRRRPATGCPNPPRKTLSVVELYAAVARGDADVIERGRAVKADWHRDPMMALVSGGCTIDALTWAGGHQAAVDLTVR